MHYFTPLSFSLLINQLNHLFMYSFIYLSVLKTRIGESSKAWSSWTKFGPCNDKCQKVRQRFCTTGDRTRCPGAGAYGIQKQPRTCSLNECYGTYNRQGG